MWVYLFKGVFNVLAHLVCFIAGQRSCEIEQLVAGRACGATPPDCQNVFQKMTLNFIRQLSNFLG